MPSIAGQDRSSLRALAATAVVAIGLHVGIVAALPHAARPHVAFSTPPVAAAAVDLVPHAPAAQFQAFAPVAPAPAAKAEAPKVKAIATPVRAAASAPKKNETATATLDMRPQNDDEPVRIATPLPVTVVEAR
ncbi:MAG TPA: hypothetical protein VIF62_02695 [Labilithrix sp.]|jgi:hypothetical protein